ncbi:hypothetical protein [Herbiconiux sp. A18JL235]|uniref:DUF4190 domain-containing protein n=1 Tax=Herbiconiux sp. A18JL235 TaxID=3152363 RepID=A0AB39BME4_9MICO
MCRAGVVLAGIGLLLAVACFLGWADLGLLFISYFVIVLGLNILVWGLLARRERALSGWMVGGIALGLGVASVVAVAVGMYVSIMLLMR